VGPRSTEAFVDSPAVILAAGSGSRLCADGGGIPKPLTPVAGISLAERALLSCLAAGVRRFVVVLGHRADEVRSHIREVASRWDCELSFAHAIDWPLGNGASTLAAELFVGGEPFLLLMADHLVEPSLLDLVLSTTAPRRGVCVAVDYDSSGVFDLEDATKVTTDGDQVVRIGKGLARWHAIDAGVLLCTPALFDALEAEGAAGRHNLTHGVSRLARDGRVTAVDTTGELWLDVNTPADLMEAEARLRRAADAP
jgi:choline kinase